ncbi:Inhibin beta B chain [Bagarius yarrelli]|uniref:Inhibin beta B chain n=1 Tax=Bagarius yarrelli TaxID=175774 RepID=A0A556VXU1_BAGYA|nr:Inhibin beta B chain [Bagarius yarrelli]
MYSASTPVSFLYPAVWTYLCGDGWRRFVLTLLVLLSALVPEILGAVTGCTTCGVQQMDKGSDEQFLIELAKKQILSKLHLRERPNITQTLPRAALATALRKLHAGRVRVDGTVELEKHLASTQHSDQAYEIVSFANMDVKDSSGDSSILSFQFLQEQGQNIQVLQSSLWVYVHPANSPLPAARVSAQVYLLDTSSGNRTLLLQRSVEVARGGWQSFPITYTMQTFLDGEQQSLQLEVHCEAGGQNLCSQSNVDASQRSYLVAQVQLRDDDSKHTVSKRSLSCGDDNSVCCKKDFYIKFQDIQWQDWIIAPEGYHMNYCIGQCPQHLAGSPGIASSFHATVFSQLKANGIQTAISSCCVPIQRRPLSMVYFNSQHSIVKTDVPDMIVESCGCT